MNAAEHRTTIHKHLRVLSGKHDGATVPLAFGTYSVGADDTCSIVLCDHGIADKHCAICIDEYGITCRALAADIHVAGSPIRRGSVAALKDFQPLSCGPVTLSIGQAEGAEHKWAQLQAGLRQHAVEPAATRFFKRNNAEVWIAVLLSGIGGIASLAYAALANNDASLSRSRIESAREWLKEIAPPSSELVIGFAGENRLLLSGYVPLAYQRDALLNAARKSDFSPRVEVHAVDQMLASLSRLAQLDALPCLPVYRTAGQAACSQPVDSEHIAQRLRQLAREVPGLTALHVSVAPAATTAEARPPLPPSPPPSLTKRFSVLMFRNARYLIGPFGERYQEGELFDGLKIDRIDVDEVVFEHAGQRYPFRVAALGAKQ
jgi:type III secretion system YscD/HrpQ family protein